MTTQMYMGRNINKDDKGYFITFSDQDIKRYIDKTNIAKAHFANETQAMSQMEHNLKMNWTWFDAHFDPTI